MHVAASSDARADFEPRGVDVLIGAHQVTIRRVSFARAIDGPRRAAPVTAPRNVARPARHDVATATRWPVGRIAPTAAPTRGCRCRRLPRGDDDSDSPRGG
jgi:hypothetical protein